MKLNGNLVFNSGGGSTSGEIQNAYIERLAAAPDQLVAEKGRIYFNTTTNAYYFNNGTAWVAFATGGDASALQSEVDSIETSLGAVVGNDGTFAQSALSGGTIINDATSITDALLQLDAAAAGADTLAELGDVDLTGLASGAFIKYDGANWVDHTLVLADVTDVTTSAAELNQLDGATFTAADLNKLAAITADAAEINILDGVTGVDAAEISHLDGVTSNIQAQLDALQTEDATLTALAALSGTGFVVETGVDTFTHRSLVAPAAGITIGNNDGVSGNPTLALANDLAALEGLATSGIIVRTGDGTATTRTITGSAGRIVVTTGDGVSGEPTIDLATVTDGNSGTFLKITRDSYGRVTGTEAVVAGDITALVDTTYVNVAGDTMTGNLNMGANFVTQDNVPTTDTQLANKAYVDSVAAGLSWKQAVRVASTANLTLASTTTVDGATLALNDRVLVKNQTAPAENGIYTFNGTGLVRATDMDAASEFAGATVFVTEGTANADSGWTQTAEVITLGTDSVTWAQFSGLSTYTWGTGLDNSGNTVFVRLGAGIAELPTDEIGLDIVSNLAVQLDSTATGGKLTFVLASGSGLEQSSAGLKISAAGVTNAMLANSSMAATADSGTGTLDLGDTLHIEGVSTQGTSVSVSESGGIVEYIVTAADASSSQKGVAKFDETEFTVTSGSVVLGTVPVNKLASNTINFVGTNASADTVTLGESYTYVDGGSAAQAGLVAVAVATNQATITLRQASTTALGVASFDTNHFSVASGAVSLAASLDDITNVTGADSAVDGDVLRFNGTNWTAESTSTLAGEIALGDLSNVGTATATDGHVLVGDGSNWNNQAIYHLHTEGSASASWTVTHGIGQKYCVVTIVDATDNVIIPNSIVFDSTTQLTVTFSSAVAGKAVVMGIA